LQLPSSVTHPENNASALLIAASFGKIIPTRILNMFPRYQRLNVHGSVVPALRGAAPVQWSIIHGMQETGASVIELAPAKQGIDTGACLAAHSVVSSALPHAEHQSARHAYHFACFESQ
jgi:methionyl-tRNA formyltransferase